ncbi:MAG: DNA ligase, partial [Marinobacter sp.]
PMQNTPFELRYQRLTALVQAAGSPYLALVRQSPVASHDALLKQLHETVAAGGEGLMLKRKAGLYQAGRSDDLLKVTLHDDTEAVVVRHLPGKGRLEGMMGALELKLGDGRQFRIGTGFSDAQRKQPPPIGATVTFRYRGHTATGLPRFARFLRVRNDEPELVPAPSR